MSRTPYFAGAMGEEKLDNFLRSIPEPVVVVRTRLSLGPGRSRAPRLRFPTAVTFTLAGLPESVPTTLPDIDTSPGNGDIKSTMPSAFNAERIVPQRGMSHDR